MSEPSLRHAILAGRSVLAHGFRPMAGWIVAVLVIAMATAACGSTGQASGNGGNNVSVKGSEYKFDPATVTVTHGEQVSLTFENTGTVAHNWKAENVPGADTGEVQPKQKKTITFTAPAAGTYKVICDLPGHAEAGMVGQLVSK